MKPTAITRPHILQQKKQKTAYAYDEVGRLVGVIPATYVSSTSYNKVNGASYTADRWDTYFFEKNLQGDVVAVYDTNGTKLISYV